MSGFEAWIGHCDLRQIEGDSEYHCQAAVWADSVETFRARVSTHVEKQGYKAFWVEECHPVSQYLQRHGTPHEIGPLARSVHQGHHVELSRLVAVGERGEPEPEKSWLMIEKIKDVEPLDGQRGVWPEKNIPDSLVEPLFGHVEPTAEEIAHYGSADAVPLMRTYIVLDGAKMQWGNSEIEACKMPCRCLFKGDAVEELKDVAPYLVELDPENRFTRCLFKYVPEMPDEMTSVHLWHKEPGIYIRTRAEFDAVWKHLRKFPRVQDDKGQWYFFRFWEPRVLRDYLYDLRHETGKIVNWFGRRAAALTLIAISGGVLHSYALAESIPNEERSEPIRLEQAVHARLHARRVMQEFAEEQDIPFDWATYQGYEYLWQDYELEDLKVIVLLHGHFAVTEKYPLDGMYPPEREHDSTRRSLLGRLIFFKAQGVPYGV